MSELLTLYLIGVFVGILLVGLFLWYPEKYFRIKTQRELKEFKLKFKEYKETVLGRDFILSAILVTRGELRETRDVYEALLDFEKVSFDEHLEEITQKGSTVYDVYGARVAALVHTSKGKYYGFRNIKELPTYF